MLAENDTYHEISARLKPEHFANKTNRDLYRIIGRIITEGREATPVTIVAMVGEEGNLGGYLRDLITSANDAYLGGIKHTVPGLADEIIDLSDRRNLIKATEEARAAAQLSPGAISTNDLHQKIESLLFQLPRIEYSHALKTANDLTNETLEAAEQIYNTGISPGFRSGFKSFDDLIGPMVPGDLIVVGGATSMGKTAAVQQVAFHTAHHRKVLVMSLEMTARQWNDRYITQLTAIPTEILEVGPFTKHQFELIRRAQEGTLQHLNMVVSDQSGLNVAQIASYARRVQKRYGLDLLVIDHLQFIQPPPNKEGPAAIADVTRDLKSSAKVLGVPVLLVSHLNREPNRRTGNRPSLADLYGGGAIEKDADSVVFVHREHYWLHRKGPDSEEDRLAWEAKLREIENEAEFILAKRRRGKGSDYRKVGFNPELTMFYEIED